jgi:TRAP-type transport system small permease protein
MFFVKILKSLDDWLSQFLIFVIVIITVVAVFMRYALHDPLQWLEEGIILLFIWEIMLGAASAMKDGQHVSIDAFTILLPLKVQRFSRIFNHLLAIAILSTFGYLGLRLALASSGKITAILGIKYLYVDIAVPVGAFWMVLHSIVRLIEEIKQVKRG